MARYMFKNDQAYLIPLLDFVNHDPGAGPFQVDEDGVGISGATQGEVFVNYTYGDAFHYLALYQFPAHVKHAYSMSLNLRLKGRLLRIGRSYLVHEELIPGGLSPRIDIAQDGSVALSMLMLGSREAAGIAIPAFKLAWEKAGLEEADSVFKEIYQINVSLFVDFLADLNGISGMAADWLRQSTYQQLKLMAEH